MKCLIVKTLPIILISAHIGANIAYMADIANNIDSKNHWLMPIAILIPRF